MAMPETYQTPVVSSLYWLISSSSFLSSSESSSSPSSYSGICSKTREISSRLKSNSYCFVRPSTPSDSIIYSISCSVSVLLPLGFSLKVTYISTLQYGSSSPQLGPTFALNLPPSFCVGFSRTVSSSHSNSRRVISSSLL